jgi:putative ABC transport system ATP-binding protein
MIRPEEPAAVGASGDAVEPVVVVRGARKTYDAATAPVRALRGADLVVEAGEFVALVGPSGSGKSTLLDVVAGLESVDDGEVVVAGHDLTRMREDALARFRRRHVGIVFQFFHLLDGLTTLENVALAAQVAGTSRRESERRAHGLLDLLGLLDKAAVSPASLSGGQRQRLSLARALANEPTLLLADEPTGALDSDGGREVLELMARLHRQGRTILVVTHDPAVAASAQRVVQLRDGRTDPVGVGP